jgi:DNA-binding NtrC family response regulator
MSEGRCLPLVASLEAWGIKSCVVQDCRKAHPLIVADAELRMILTEESLPDGSWRDLAQASAANKMRVPVVVCLRHPNGGRSDLLESGALLLVEPFEFKSLQPVVAQAVELWRRWNSKWPDACAYSDDASVPFIQVKPAAASRGRGEVRPSRQRRRRVNSRL